MYFASPTQLYWLLLAIPVVLLYFVALTRRRRELSTVALWRRALAQRSAWARWRRPVSVLAVLLALTLLVFAAADPRLSEAAGARAIVVILDNSASMRAHDLAPTRFERAKRDAARIFDSLPLGDRAALLSAGSLTRIHCRLTSDHVVLDHALASVSVTDGRTNLAEAVVTARRLLAGVPNSQIIVITDGCFDDAGLAAADDVRWIVHRGRGENVAVTRFEPRANDALGRYAFLVEVTNFGAEPHNVTLQIDAKSGKQPLLTESLTLEPDETVRRFGDLPDTRADLLTARVQSNDALAADNFARCVIPARPPVPIRLIGRPNPSLEKALRAVGGRFELVSTNDEQASPPAAAEGPRITVVNRSTEDEALPRGPLLVIAPQTDAAGLWRYTGLTDAGAPDDDALGVAVAADASIQASPLGPLNVELQEMAIGQSVVLDWKVAHTVVALTAAGRELASVVDRPEGRIVVFQAPLESTDLSEHSAFPLLIDRLLHLALADEAPSEADYNTNTTVAYSPRSAAQVESPRGESIRLRHRGNEPQPRYMTLDQVGPWRELADDEQLRSVIYANLLDRRESDILADSDVVSQPWQEPARVRIPLWVYFAVAALLLVAAEWTLYRRGVLE